MLDRERFIKDPVWDFTGESLMEDDDDEIYIPENDDINMFFLGASLIDPHDEPEDDFDDDDDVDFVPEDTFSDVEEALDQNDDEDDDDEDFHENDDFFDDEFYCSTPSLMDEDTGDEEEEEAEEEGESGTRVNVVVSDSLSSDDEA